MTRTAPLEALLTADEVGDVLRLSTEHVRRLTRRGALKAVRPAGAKSWKGRLLYDPADVRAFITARRT